MRYSYLLAAVIVASVANDATAKCMPLRLSISGDVAGDVQGLSVRASVAPSDRAQSVSVELTSSEFELVLIFDTYSGRGLLGGDRCAAQPKEVRVAVLNKDAMLETRVLRWKDFSEESLGRYVVRSRVNLVVPPTKRPN